jgi:hypothetical protein
VFKALAGLWHRQEPVADVPALRRFLTAESAFLAQKTTVEYCRARSGLLWQKLFSEAAFRAALDACRWGAMAAALADQMVVTEMFLRRNAENQEPALATALASLYADILRGYDEVPPEQRVHWDELIAEMAPRLARLQLGPPHAPNEIAKTAGGRIFDLLPVHKSLRGLDREMMVNAIRFGMVGFHRKLEESVTDPAALVRDLIARS